MYKHILQRLPFWLVACLLLAAPVHANSDSKYADPLPLSAENEITNSYTNASVESIIKEWDKYVQELHFKWHSNQLLSYTDLLIKFTLSEEELFSLFWKTHVRDAIVNQGLSYMNTLSNLSYNTENIKKLTRNFIEVDLSDKLNQLNFKAKSIESIYKLRLSTSESKQNMHPVLIGAIPNQSHFSSTIIMTILFAFYLFAETYQQLSQEQILTTDKKANL